MLNSGFWTIARYAGAPVRVHWSVLLLMLYFGGWQPGAWVGIVVLVLAHELGHAAIVRVVGAHVTEVMVYGFGGYCGWRGYVGPRARALIAWGGIFAQAVLLVVAWTFRAANPAPGPFMHALLYALIEANLVLMAINLIPLSPLDGASAWPLVGILRDDLVRWWRDRRPPPASPARRWPENPSPPVEEPPPSSRVTDPEVADRVFERVFKGLVDRPMADASEDEASPDEAGGPADEPDTKKRPASGRDEDDERD